MDRAEFIDKMVALFGAKNAEVWGNTAKTLLPLTGVDFEKLFNKIATEWQSKTLPTIKFVLDFVPQCKIYTNFSNRYFDIEVMRCNYPYVFALSEKEYANLINTNKTGIYPTSGSTKAFFKQIKLGVEEFNALGRKLPYKVVDET